MKKNLFCKYKNAKSYIKSDRKKYIKSDRKKYNQRQYYKRQKKEYNAIKGKIIRDIRRLFEPEEEDHYEPVKIGNAFSNNYIEYKSEVDKNATNRRISS